MPLARRSKRTHPDLIGQLDTQVSLFVRLTAASKSERKGWVQCYTCGEWHHWQDIDCGHYIPRGRFGTRFDLRHLRPQDRKCNYYGEGEHWKFRELLVEEIGEAEVLDLEMTANRWGFNKHPDDWLRSEIARYKALNSPLLRRALEWE